MQRAPKCDEYCRAAEPLAVRKPGESMLRRTHLWAVLLSVGCGSADVVPSTVETMDSAGVLVVRHDELTATDSRRPVVRRWSLVVATPSCSVCEVVSFYQMAS